MLPKRGVSYLCIWPLCLVSIKPASRISYIITDRLCILVTILPLSTVAKVVLQITSLKLLIPQVYCICNNAWIAYVMAFGIEQQDGSLINPLALVHPLHAIRNRSKNKHRNLWAGRCVSSWWLWIWSVNSVYYHIHIVYYRYILSNWNKLFWETYTYQGSEWQWRCVG